jgi:hypothetical protein
MEQVEVALLDRAVLPPRVSAQPSIQGAMELPVLVPLIVLALVAVAAAQVVELKPTETTARVALVARHQLLVGQAVMDELGVAVMDFPLPTQAAAVVVPNHGIQPTSVSAVQEAPGRSAWFTRPIQPLLSPPPARSRH